MQIPCVYIPGPAPAVSVANNYDFLGKIVLLDVQWYPKEGFDVNNTGQKISRYCPFKGTVRRKPRWVKSGINC
jgi:hypothetical protein